MERDQGGNDAQALRDRDRPRDGAPAERRGDGGPAYHAVLDPGLAEALDVVARARIESAWDDDLTVLGHCPHGVDLDREFCAKGCRV